jgi:predicted RNase H-like HicB family nuclease
MSKYEIRIFWSDEDKAYLAEVPELPGCMADGKTYEEALQNAETIINEWIETAQAVNRPVPQPHSMNTKMYQKTQQREYAYA